MLTIEKNIPMPDRVRARGVPRASVFWVMEVGDSVFTEHLKGGGLYSYVAKKTGRKFAQRKEGDGCRVWRVA